MYRTIIERYMVAEDQDELDWLAEMLELYPFNTPLKVVLL